MKKFRSGLCFFRQAGAISVGVVCCSSLNQHLIMRDFSVVGRIWTKLIQIYNWPRRRSLFTSNSTIYKTDRRCRNLYTTRDRTAIGEESSIYNSSIYNWPHWHCREEIYLQLTQLEKSETRYLKLTQLTLQKKWLSHALFILPNFIQMQDKNYEILITCNRMARMTMSAFSANSISSPALTLPRRLSSSPSSSETRRPPGGVL